MKKILFIFIMAFMLCMIMDASAFTFSSKTSLSGKITDKQTGQTIPGVSIFIPDLKTGTVSKVDGTYRIDNLPQSKVLIQISFIGYKTIIETLDLSQITTKDYAM